MNPAPAAPRVRSRIPVAVATPAVAAPVTAPTSPDVPQALKDLAKTHYTNNKAMNAAKGKSEKARTSLYQEMKAKGIPSFSFVTELEGGKKATLDVLIATPEKMAIDVEKLLEIVGKEKFMQIVSASQKAVEDGAGKAVVAQCLITAKGEENVKVSAAD